MYGERKIRNLNPEATVAQPPFVNKSFNWDRNYNLSYDLAKAIKLDFSANNRALVREYEGERIERDPTVLTDKEDPEENGLGGYVINPENGQRIYSYELHRDSLISSLKQLGLTTNYNHNTSVSYNVPLSKIPLLDWTSLTARYTGTYDWQRGPLLEADVVDSLGNTISNGQQVQLNASLNMLSLYNKVPYLRDVNRGKRGKSKSNKKKEKSADEKSMTKKDGKDDDKDEKNKKEKDQVVIKSILKGLMSIKSVSGTYSLNRGNTLPGFGGQPNYLGLDNSADRSYGYEQDVFNYGSPGLGFVFGQQEQFSNTSQHFADYAGNEKRWLVANENIFNPYLRSRSEQLNFRASVQPMRDLRIDLTANENTSTNWTEFWTYDEMTDEWSEGKTRLETGNYSASIITLATALETIDSSNFTVYNEFLANRVTVSQRLGEEAGITSRDPGGYTTGYDSAHQDVLIPAFFAAYTGQSSGDVSTNPLKNVDAAELENKLYWVE